jgi:hypothetical protein
VKVLDFGILKSATGTELSLTQTSSVLGTPAYMSPEQSCSTSSSRVAGRFARRRSRRCASSPRSIRTTITRARAGDPALPREGTGGSVRDDRRARTVRTRCVRAKFNVDRAHRVLERVATGHRSRSVTRQADRSRSRVRIAWRMQRTKPAAAMEEGEGIEMHAIIDVDAAAPVSAITPDATVAIDAAAPTPDAGSAKRAVRRGATGSGSAIKKCNVWESRTGCT